VNATQNTNITTATNDAQAAFAQANATVGGLITANARITVSEGVDVGQNTRMSIIEGVDATQNTNITIATNAGQSAFAQANATAGGLITANARITVVEGVNTDQNTNITIATNAATASFAQANATAGGLTSANTRLSIIEGVDLDQNTRITAADAKAQAAFNAANNASGGGEVIDSYARTTANTATSNITILQGVDTTQNTNITTATNAATASFAQANATAGGLITANARITVSEGVDATQNTDITTANNAAQAAFALANNNLININNLGDAVALVSATEITQNTRLSIIEGVDVTQNTRLSIIEGVDTTQNTRLDIIEGVNTTQNTNITNIDAKAQAAFNAANSASGGGGEVIDSYARTTANSKFNSTGGTISGSVVISNDLTVNGNVSFIGNVTSVTVTGNSGQFFGYAANGFQALYSGIPTGYLLEPQIVQQSTANFDGYAGINIQNINNGQQSSGDYFITADNGSPLEGYLDLGLAGSTYNYNIHPGFNLIKPNDGYLIVSGNTATNRGNLILGTVLSDDIIFAAHGINTENEVMRITSSNTVLIKGISESASKSSGALQVVGGIGAGGSIYALNIVANVIPLQASHASNTTVGYLGVPQSPLSPMTGNYTLVISDSGEHLYMVPNANTYNVFIPSNASVPFPVGTAIVTVLNATFTSNVVPTTGVTLRAAGNTSGANAARTLGSYSMSSLLKVENDVWYISGSGVT
jgi:hypothetical protein